MIRTLYKPFLIWCLVLVLAFANGAAREVLLIPSFGRSTGLIASGVMLSIMVVLVALASIHWITPKSNGHARYRSIRWLPQLQRLDVSKSFLRLVTVGFRGP